MIITLQYLAQLYGQQDEYHLNQVSNPMVPTHIHPLFDGTQTCLSPLKLGATYLGIA